MAINTIRINGTSSQAKYGYYANVLVWDNINEQGGITVQVNTYLVNNGSWFSTSGWTKHTRIHNVGEETLTNQSINTTNVNRYGGITLVQSKTYNVPLTLTQINVVSYLSKSSYASYEPGYCELSGIVSMPKVQSTWGSSLISIPDITGSFTLPINKYVSDYYNIVTVENSNNTIRVKTINGAYNGQSVTFTSSELNTLYSIDNNANQLPLVFYMDLYTYSDSTDPSSQIGTAQRVKCEAYIVNGEPTFTFTKEETDNYVINIFGTSANNVVRYASDVLFTINTTPKYGATITNVKVYTLSDYILATKQSDNLYTAIRTINDDITPNLSIEVTDSRGLSTLQIINVNVVDYILVSINSLSIERASQVSSDLVINANINCFSGRINGQQNIGTVRYSLDNTNWTNISGSSFVFQDNKITITNLTLSNVISYQSSGTFYLQVYDPLTWSFQNLPITKGIETFSYGENDLQVNGEIYIADEEGDNPIPLAHSYSTNEVIVGYWIDNKPIYRKVIIITGSSYWQTSSSYSLSSLNIDTSISEKNLLYFTMNNMDYAVDDYYSSAEQNYRTFIRDNKLEIRIGSYLIANGTFDKLQVIIEYTKTTD